MLCFLTIIQGHKGREPCMPFSNLFGYHQCAPNSFISGLSINSCVHMWVLFSRIGVTPAFRPLNGAVSQAGQTAYRSNARNESLRNFEGERKQQRVSNNKEKTGNSKHSFQHFFPNSLVMRCRISLDLSRTWKVAKILNWKWKKLEKIVWKWLKMSHLIF